RVTIEGPFHPTGVADTPSRRAIFVCRPSSANDEMPCAKTIIANLTRRAYRRPVTDADVNPLLDFYSGVRRKGEGFEAGIETALRALLARPQFWYRIERDAVDLPANGIYRISEIELASRLAFFLWSSIPDDELLQIAAAGKLRDAATL